MNSIVTIAEHVVLKHFRNLKRPLTLYGRIHGKDVSVWSVEKNLFLEPVGVATPLPLPDDQTANVPLVVEVDGTGLLGGTGVRASVLGKGGMRLAASFHLVGVERDLQARHAGLLENAQLRSKSVRCVGVGSVTAKMLRPLVEAGVGHIGLADGQVFAPENVGRHALGVDAIGLPKATALADQLRLVNPELRTSTLTVPLGPDTRDRYRAFLKGASLVVIATDSIEVNLEVQALCLDLGCIPAVVVGCWERAFAGEVIYSDVRRGTPCYGCIREALPGTGAARGPVDYSSTPSAESPPQPGLGADVNYIAATAIKVCMIHLMRDWKAGLVTREKPVLLVSTRAEEMFSQACQVSQLRAKPNPDCWLCSGLRPLAE